MHWPPLGSHPFFHFGGFNPSFKLWKPYLLTWFANTGGLTNLMEVPSLQQVNECKVCRFILMEMWNESRKREWVTCRVYQSLERKEWWMINIVIEINSAKISYLDDFDVRVEILCHTKKVKRFIAFTPAHRLDGRILVYFQTTPK